MPYIQKDRREGIDSVLHKLDRELDKIAPCTVGDLNYIISLIIHYWLPNKRNLHYQDINEVIGVLECAKLELYRMVAAKYEDKKRIENGSVSELDTKTLEDVR